MAAGKWKIRIRDSWRRFSSSGSLRNLLLFIPFLAIAAVFWLIVALDDDLQDEYTVRIEITNVPDSVTFIQDPPGYIRVNVRDRGTKIMSRVFMGAPVLKIDFRNFSRDGVMRVGQPTMQSYLRNIFGSTAQILSASPDSVRVDYTASAAKEVPVVVVADILPEIGKTIGGKLTVAPARVKVYSRSAVTDTLQAVYTYPIVRRDLSTPQRLRISLKPIPGCRIEPSDVTVTIPIEPLENRSVIVPVSAVNVPVTESLMVYPRTVKVSYLVPMSVPDIVDTDFRVVVDYSDVQRYDGKNIPLHLHTLPSEVVSATMECDSVEYTVIYR